MNTCYELLNQQSVSNIEPLYQPNTINKWNELFDDVFSKQTTKRRYVFADDLYKLNLLDEIFTPELQSLLYQLLPDAELYHCHAYEIAANQNKPHIIGDNNLGGWHRDIDCKHDFAKPNLQHISLFIYLTDVSEGNGYFEISNKRLSILPSFGNTANCYKLFGNKGQCFLFDRKAFHRASPNTSTSVRRVLKISIQSKSLFNHKLNTDAFIAVKDQLNNNQPFLRQLFGDKNINTKEVDSYAKQHLSSNKFSGELPPESYQENFSLMQNYRRYIRDFRYASKRLAIKYFQLNDAKTPISKIKNN